jgi:2-oxoglutarate dehydrogenase E1 component
LDDTRAHAPAPTKVAKPPKPVGVLPHVNTGVERATLDRIFAQLTNYPADFTPHPKLAKQFEARAKAYNEQGDIEWATGEALAFGSLVLEGCPVRLAGEDSRRGTFSQRHAALIDNTNERVWIPLSELPGAEKFWVYDSLLSEYAAVGFEYGYAHANPEALVLWEAQFGDFVNGAQIIIDQYIVAAEDKWNQHNALVMLLPHGYEGQGPEHSSARIERFLTLCAEDNIQVVNATTAAQYFHVLRRQMHREVRKPLVIFTPKAPLRMKESRSPISDLESGTSFQEVLDDPAITDRASVKRVVFCSGKVAWDAMSERNKRNAPVAVVRVEQLYPFPIEQMTEILASYPNAREVVWLQEEPSNMGPWHFVEHRLWRIKDQGYDLRHVARVASGSPATGSKTVHDQELADLMDETFQGL